MPYKGIIRIEYETQYQCCSSFMRMQEFYESPIRGIRGMFFTTEQFMDAYVATKAHGRFTYFDDWGGFNLPSETIKHFVNVFYGNLNVKEQTILHQIDKILEENKMTHADKYYVIGTFGDWNGGDTTIIDHEIAHAIYYLDHKYKIKVNRLIAENLADSSLKKLEAYLKRYGYTDDVLLDEIQAYLATGRELLCGVKHKRISGKLNELYWKHRNKLV
jgi:hypothetical protein